MTLAAEMGATVGVDVMDLRVPSRQQTVAQYFALMRSQFTAAEWRTVEAPVSDMDRLVCLSCC